MVGHLSSRQVLSGARAEERERAEDGIQARRHPSEGAQTPREHSEGRITLKETLILVSLLCNTKVCFLSTVYSRISIGQKGEQPVNPRNRGQIQSQLQPVRTIKKGNQQRSCIFSICHFFCFPPSLRSLSHHEDEEVSQKLNYNIDMSCFCFSQKTNNSFIPSRMSRSWTSLSLRSARCVKTMSLSWRQRWASHLIFNGIFSKHLNPRKSPNKCVFPLETVQEL